MNTLDKFLLKEERTFKNYDNIRSEYFHFSDQINWTLFLPWNTSIETALKVGIIPKFGRGLVYEGPRSLVGITPEIAVDAIQRLKKDLEEKKNFYNFPKFNLCLGYSVGILPASYICTEFEIEELTLFAPGAKLGQNIWESSLTNWVREEVISRGILDHEEFDSRMQGMNPIDVSKRFPENTTIIYGTSDRVSPVKNVESLINSCNKGVKVIKLPLQGHVTTILSSRFLF